MKITIQCNGVNRASISFGDLQSIFINRPDMEIIIVTDELHKITLKDKMGNETILKE